LLVDIDTQRRCGTRRGRLMQPDPTADKWLMACASLAVSLTNSWSHLWSL